MLEVIATCLEDVKRIERAGGKRIELISSYTEGGLTPSYAFIKSGRSSTNTDSRYDSSACEVFTYTEEEIEMMKEDIVVAQKLGVAGVVLGVLNERNEVNEEKLADLLSVVDGINVTYHRAIDDIENPVEAMRTLKKFHKVTHVLTSGGQGNIVDNIPVLTDMQKVSDGQIQLVVGAGVTKENIKQLLDETGISQAHVGTAVREGKSCFAEIDSNLVQELVQIIQ